jgi:predicted phage terminase large subunit-like protein
MPKSWEIARHIVAISEYVDRLRKGEISRLRVTMPPRHAKTETITIRLAVRWLKDHPEDNILVTGYNQRYANRMSRKIRNEARRAGVQLARGNSAVDEWATTAGGCVVAKGVGSPPTGIGFQLILIDDPVRDSKQVESQGVRESINNWYLTDIYQRLEPDAKIVLVMTQWHELDLATVAIESEPDQWHSLVLPAIATENDPIGRKVGEALWPNRFPIERLEQIRRVMSSVDGPRMFNALFLCAPHPKDGLMIKRSDFKIIQRGMVPEGLRWVRAYDAALTASDEGDETVGALGAIDARGNVYVMHMDGWREEPSETILNMSNLAESDLREFKCQVLGIERPLAGSVIMKMLKRVAKIAHILVKPIEINGRDKKVRAASWAMKLRLGQFYLVEGAWNEKLIEQATKFRGVKADKDDWVDAISNLMELIALTDGANQNGKQKQIVKYSREYWQAITG